MKQVVVDSGERGFQYAISLSARLADQMTALHTEAAAIENKKSVVAARVPKRSMSCSRP